MDTFLPKVFSEPAVDADALDADAWIFSCKCHKYHSSREPEVDVEVGGWSSKPA